VSKAWSKNSEAKLIKWVGSKEAVVDQILPHLEAQPIRRFVEPMCGSAVVSLRLAGQVDGLVLGDQNKRLINMLTVVRDNPAALIDQVRRLAVGYDAEGADKHAIFKWWRVALNDDYEDHVLAAAIFLLVNRTAFNGLYRENAHGEFNVGWGKKASCAVDTIVAGILEATSRLAGAVIAAGDFTSLWLPEAGDLWFFDPPYDGKFSGYGGGWHAERDLTRLATFARMVVEKGGRAFVCNSDTPQVRAAFEGAVFHPISGRTSVSQSSGERGSTQELLIEVRG